MRVRHLGATAAAIVIFAAGSCTGASRSAEAYCERLELATGPQGAEVAFDPGDPARLDGLVNELRGLLDRAPDEISTATATLLDFFESYQRAPRDERSELLSEREAAFTAASRELDAYAVSECGLFLQRSVPTPVPTVDPGVEIAPE